MGRDYSHVVREASEKGHLSKELCEMREQTPKTPRGQAFQVVERAHAKALNQQHSWCFRRRFEGPRATGTE